MLDATSQIGHERTVATGCFRDLRSRHNPFDDMSNLDRYQTLIDGYEQGLYTAREVVGQAFDMLLEGGDREALWHALRTEHRDELSQYLIGYDESTPPVLPHEHWLKVKEDTLALKRWFVAR